MKVNRGRVSPPPDALIVSHDVVVTESPVPGGQLLCALCAVQCVVRSVQCSVCSVQCAMFSV